MSTLSRVHPNAEVVDTDVGEGEVALLHLGTKTYFSLNVTGARIWEHLKAGCSLDDVCLRLQEEFDVDSERARKSVRDLVRDLLRHNLAQAG